MRRLAATVILVLLVAFRADAQEVRHTGITMGYPESIGLVVQVSERFAVRPELTVNRRTSEASFPIAVFPIETLPIGTLTSDTWAVGAGFSGLFYVQRWDKLRAYLSPRYSYSRSSGTSGDSIFGQASKTTSSTHAVFGFIGAEYALHERFSVFGEVGGGYMRGKTSGAATRLLSNAWGTRTGAGVTFYF